MSSPLWQAIDPMADLGRFAPPTMGEASPTGQYVSTSYSPVSPEHPHFGFGLALLITAGLLYYAFEEGAGVNARFGALHAGAGVSGEE